MERIIRIKCFDKCVYNLNFPAIIEASTLAKCKKLFQFLFQYDYKDGNDETIAFLDNALPALCEKKKMVWRDKSIDFQNGYLSTDRAAFPQLFYRKQIIEEVARRKKNNDGLMRAVKKAKNKKSFNEKGENNYVS